MTQTVRVEGLAELRETLMKRLPEALQGKALQGALAQGAKPIVAAARARAPVKTGRLKKAIYSYRNRESRRTYESRLISVRQGRKFQKSGRDAFYWKWIEFGHGVITLQHRRKSGGNKGRLSRSLGTPAKGFFGREIKAAPARPFMRPAFESKKLAALEAIRQSLAGQIEKVATRAMARSRSRLGRALRRTITGL
mgnify:CR=1 FL=1